MRAELPVKAERRIPDRVHVFTEAGAPAPRPAPPEIAPAVEQFVDRLRALLACRDELVADAARDPVAREELQRVDLHLERLAARPPRSLQEAIRLGVDVPRQCDALRAVEALMMSTDEDADRGVNITDDDFEAVAGQLGVPVEQLRKALVNKAVLALRSMKGARDAALLVCEGLDVASVSTLRRRQAHVRANAAKRSAPFVAAARRLTGRAAPSTTGRVVAPSTKGRIVEGVQTSSSVGSMNHQHADAHADSVSARRQRPV
jgi:hypothetical protein